MSERDPPRPTDAELAILRCLWTSGPSTVRQVQECLNESRPTGYTTALKHLQIMVEKGLVVRDESLRAHVYQAAHSKEQTQRQLVGDLLERAFGGSAAQLVVHALHDSETSAEELSRIRELLDELEDKADGPRRKRDR